MANDQKERKCGPCCHNGHGVKKVPVRVPGGRSYICWLEDCKKTVARRDEIDVWHFDPCDHVKRNDRGGHGVLLRRGSEK